MQNFVQSKSDELDEYVPEAISLFLFVFRYSAAGKPITGSDSFCYRFSKLTRVSVIASEKQIHIRSNVVT